jgi:hypothetical protein
VGKLSTSVLNVWEKSELNERWKYGRAYQILKHFGFGAAMTVTYRLLAWNDV